MPSPRRPAPGSSGLVTIAADVRDPGNAGTLVRTSDALGAHAVVLAGHSVDPYNPKTVRASVGSLFHLPFALEPDPARAVGPPRRPGLIVLAADGDGEVALDDAAEILAGPTAWLFGNEAWGLPAELAGTGRPPGRDPDPRTRGEPQPGDGGRDLPPRELADALSGRARVTRQSTASRRRCSW